MILSSILKAHKILLTKTLKVNQNIRDLKVRVELQIDSFSLVHCTARSVHK